MRLSSIAVLCLCVWVAAADVAHLKAAKARLLGRLASKHRKRGVLSAVPPYKLGYDIPVVTHSLVKPLVVSYPPTAAVTAVKVPLTHPLTGKYPVPVGHRVPVPHPHYGLKFPHHTKTVLFPKPDHHFHHHHHHVEPKPVVPIVPAPVPATPVVPVGQPTATIAHPVPGPPPPRVLLQPAPVPAPAPAHVLPAPPLHILPPEHLHLRPLLPAPPAPAPVVSPAGPLLQYAHQFPYVLRPGNAVQTSFFATYPRFPLINYQSPLIPYPQAGPAQVLFNRPQVHPYHLLPQPAGHEGVVFEQHGGPVPVEPTTLLHPTGEVPQPAVHLQPTQSTLHLQPAQPGVHLHPDAHFQHGQPDVHLQAQPGVLQSDVHFHAQPGVLQPDVHLHAQPGALQPNVHLHGQPGVLQPDLHLQGQPGGVLQTDVHFQGQPDLHLHGAQSGVYQPGQSDFQLQPGVVPTQPTIHLQPTPTVPQVDHDGWSPVQTQPQDFAGSQQGNFGQGGQFGHDGQLAQGGQFGHDGQFGQGGQFAHDGQLGQGVQFGHDGQFGQGGQFGHDGQFGQGGQFSHDGQLGQGGQFGHHGQFAQGGQFGHDGQVANEGHHQFTQDQGTQVYEQHSGNDQYDYQNQLQIQQHIQQQIEQAQYEQHLNNQHQLGQEYGVPHQNQDFSQQGQDFSQQGQDFSQQGQDFSQHGRDLAQDGHDFGNQGQDFPQQDENFNGQPAQEYGVPQDAEGRSAEGDDGDSQIYHNHIPLGLQPPIDRPLEHFR